MPTKKKSQSRNPFYFYMLDFKAAMERKGHHYPGGMKDVSVAADASWKRMSPQEKKQYEDRATRERGGSDKFTTLGTSYRTVENEQSAVREKELLMKKTIKDTLIQLGRNTGLSTASFFFIHVHHFVRKDNGPYYPAEVALMRYSISNGGELSYHTLVNPGELPTGYVYQATLHSNATHKLPLPPYCHKMAEVKSSLVLDKIEQYVYQYLEKDEPMPPFYTLVASLHSTECILQQWCAENNRRENPFRVFSIEQLFFDIKNFALRPEGHRLVINGVQDNGFSHYSIAENFLLDDIHAHAQRIACTVHEEEVESVDSCSRSLVTRWGWVFSNHLCANLGIQMIASVHAPWNADPRDLVLPEMAMQSAHDHDETVPEEPGFQTVKSRSERQVSAPLYDHPAVNRAGTSRGEVLRKVEHGRMGYDLPPVTSPRRQDDNDKPLRQPKSMGISQQITKMEKASLKAGDFPSLDGLSLDASDENIHPQAGAWGGVAQSAETESDNGSVHWWHQQAGEDAIGRGTTRPMSRGRRGQF